MPLLHRFVVVALATMGACSRPETAPRFAPPTDARTEAVASDAEDDAAVEFEVAQTPTHDVITPDTAAAVPAEVDAEVCRLACDNALAVTLAELPDSAAPSMRDELTRALREECPSRCVAKSSLESARCIAAAKSALALAACP